MSEKSMEYSEYEGNLEEQMVHDHVVDGECCVDFLDAYLTDTFGRKTFDDEGEL